MKNTQEGMFPPIFWLLFAMNFCHMMIQNLLNVMPAYLADLHQSESVIGFFQIIPSLCLTVFIVFISIRPIGNAKRIILRIGFGLSSAGLLLSALFYASLPVLFAGRFLMAIGYGSGFSLLFSMMYDHTSEKRRFQSAAVFGISGLLTNAFGSIGSEYIYKAFHTWPVFLLPMIFALMAFFLTFGLKCDHEKPHRRTESLRELMAKLIHHRDFGKLTFLTISFGLCFAVFWNFIVRITQVRLGDVNIMPFFMMFTFIAVLNRALLSNRTQNWGIRMLLVVSFSMILGALIVFYFFNSTWQLYLIGAIYAIAHSILYPLLSSAFVSMDIKDKALINNYFILLFTLGSTGSTQIFAFVADLFGFDPIILCGAIVAAIAALISVMTFYNENNRTLSGAEKESL